jgi:hypothetical protein
MRPTITTLSLLLAVFVCCSTPKKQFLKDIIIGEWSISNIQIDDKRIIFNVLPKIQFNKNGTAIIRILDSSTNLNWFIQDSIMEIKNINNDKYNLFPDNQYHCELTTTYNYLELKLTIININHYYILRRTTN